MHFSLLFSKTDTNKLYCINNNGGAIIYFLSNTCLFYLEYYFLWFTDVCVINVSLIHLFSYTNERVSKA